MRITEWSQGYKIDWIYINEDIFQEEKSEYEIRDKENLIDNLIDWISECRNSDKELMKNDLKLLMDMDEDYILSSIQTNDYADSKTDWYDVQCNNILKINKTLWK